MSIQFTVIMQPAMTVQEQTTMTVQEQTTIIAVLRKVTTCLYLMPRNRARNLSTLIAASVNKDDKQRAVLM